MLGASTCACSLSSNQRLRPANAALSLIQPSLETKRKTHLRRGRCVFLLAHHDRGRYNRD